MKQKHIIYVFQGGGALGSFQVGGVCSLYNAGYKADGYVGISIGAINAAILCGNTEADGLKKLKKFWGLITTDIKFPYHPKEFSKVHNSIGAQYAMNFGQNNFFKPKRIHSILADKDMKPEDISFYDTTPLRNTLLKLIDFDLINSKQKRLCLGATNLSTGQFVFFDNQKDIITVDHVMASAALPPGFPPVKIGGEYYIDGGVYSNTPMTKVLDEFAESENNIKSVLCFMFDLFSAEGVLPHSMDGVMERVKDIQFSSHSKRASHIFSTVQNMSHAIRYMSQYMPEDIKNTNEMQEIMKLGLAHELDLVHIIYKSKQGTELQSKDYNFSKRACAAHFRQGYRITSEIIKEHGYEWEVDSKGFSVYLIDDKKLDIRNNGYPGN